MVDPVAKVANLAALPVELELRDASATQCTSLFRLRRLGCTTPGFVW